MTRRCGKVVGRGGKEVERDRKGWQGGGEG